MTGNRAIWASLVVVLWVLQTTTGAPAPAPAERKAVKFLGPLEFGDAIALDEGVDKAVVAPDLAASGSNVYVCWEGGPNDDVLVTGSSSAGASFWPPTNVSKTARRSWNYDIAAAGDYAYVAWRDECNRHDEIYFARRSSPAAKKVGGGAVTFSSPVNLSNSPELDSFDPRVAAAGSSVYVLWMDETDPTWGYRLLLRASGDNGASFSDTIDLSPTYDTRVSSNLYAMVAVGPYVHLLIGGGTYQRSTDHGATFSDRVPILTHAGGLGDSLIAAAGSNVYAVCTRIGDEGGNEDVFLRVSRDAGASWGDLVRLSNSEARSLRPEVAAADSNVYVLWREDVGGDEDILCRASNNGGATFSPAVNLSDSDANAVSPSISALGNAVYVAWQQYIPEFVTYHIVLRHSQDGGLHFADAVDLAQRLTPRGSASSPIAVGHATGVHVAWRDHARGAVYCGGRFGTGVRGPVAEPRMQTRR